MTRGQPREQYQRTYVLLPPSAGAAWASAVINGAWDKHRYTIGSSADDAGIGDLDVRRIIAVNPGEWPGDLVEFYRQYYPGVQYHAVAANTPRELEIELKLAEQFDWQVIEPEPEPLPAFPIRGLHDLSGGDWLLNNGLSGWCLQSEYLNLDPKKLDFRRYEDAGVRVIVRLNYSYAMAADGGGGQGTIAPLHQLEQFEDAVVQTIYDCQGAFAFIYCNEPNNVREWPRDTTVTPGYYVGSYNRIWNRILPQHKLSPAAIDPYNAAVWGDWRVIWRDALLDIHGADWWALHAYSHGRYDDHDKRFGDPPLTDAFYNLRTIQDQKAILPFERPIIVTECNHLLKDNGTIGWENDDTWARFAFDYLKSQGAIGVCLFRYGFDEWNIDDKPKVMEAVRDAG